MNSYGKGYIALFVCCITKAIHLELVTTLSTEAFLATLNRFSKKRITFANSSDNGSNFVGVARELKELYEFLLKENAEIQAYLAEQKTE